jgi:hypothetical protein
LNTTVITGRNVKFKVEFTKKLIKSRLKTTDACYILVQYLKLQLFLLFHSAVKLFVSCVKARTQAEGADPSGSAV